MPELAGDENDAAPVALHHRRQIVTRQPDAAHDVDVEEVLPVAIRNLGKGFRLEDTDIVDQDIGVACPGDEGRDALGAGEIARRCLDSRFWLLFNQAGFRAVHGFLAASVDDHCGAGLRKSARNGEADASRRSGDDGALAAQIDVHEINPVLPDPELWADTRCRNRARSLKALRPIHIFGMCVAAKYTSKTMKSPHGALHLMAGPWRPI